MPALHRHEEEKFFLNAKGQKETLPSIWDLPTKQLSVVVPSYNEEKRCKPSFDFFGKEEFGKKRKFKVFDFTVFAKTLIEVGCVERTVDNCCSSAEREVNICSHE